MTQFKIDSQIGRNGGSSQFSRLLLPTLALFAFCCSIANAAPMLQSTATEPTTETSTQIAAETGPDALSRSSATETSATVGTDDVRQATITIDGMTTVHAYRNGAPAAPLNNPISNKPAEAPKRQIAGFNPVLWIFDVALSLHTDYDHDGHYTNFNLTLDLDTALQATTVYAILYLGTDGGPWNEYAVTGNFTVSGAGSSDSFSLQAELDTGYPSGYYNHYIEVYDAYNNELLGVYGPSDSHQFYGIPIESRQHDSELNFGTDLRLSFSGTGSMELGSLCLLAGFLAIRRRRQALHKSTRTQG